MIGSRLFRQRGRPNAAAYSNLGGIYIALGSIGGLIALIVFVAVAGGGLLSGDPTAMTITTIVGASIAAFFVIMSAPAIIAGVGLYRRRSWARPIAIVLGFLLLWAVPIGTAIGIYTIWVLIQAEAAEYLESGHEY
jgi:hypothetical protein